MKDKNLCCPVCGSKLIVTHRGNYSDIQDRVSWDNSTPSLKEGYQCIHIGCVASEYGLTWIEDGSMYIRTDFIPEDITFTMVRKRINELCGENTNAINSWNYYYHNGINAVKKRTISIKFFKYKMKIIPKTYGYKYSEDKQFMPRLIGWKFEYFKKSSEYGHTQIIPVSTMVNHQIKNFTNIVKRLEKSENKDNMKGDILDAVSIIRSLHYKSPDNRKFSKISAWIVNHFYKNDVRYILDLASTLKLIEE